MTTLLMRVGIFGVFMCAFVDGMSLRKTGNEVDIEAAARIAADPYDYGVDFSFPIHHYQRGDTPLGQYFKQVCYLHFLLLSIKLCYAYLLGL